MPVLLEKFLISFQLNSTENIVLSAFCRIYNKSVAHVTLIVNQIEWY